MFEARQRVVCVVDADFWRASEMVARFGLAVAPAKGARFTVAETFMHAGGHEFLALAERPGDLIYAACAFRRIEDAELDRLREIAASPPAEAAPDGAEAGA